MTAEAPIRLVGPCAELREAYIEYVKECREAGETLGPWVLARPTDDFRSLIRWMKEQSEGIGVKEGFVANSTFWLVDSNGRILGVTNLRHKLTDRLLREGGHISYGVRPSERDRATRH